MSECIEDLLVDLGEVLFSELAYFRLMQDVDTRFNTALKERLRMFAAKVVIVKPIMRMATNMPLYYTVFTHATVG